MSKIGLDRARAYKALYSTVGMSRRGLLILGLGLMVWAVSISGVFGNSGLLQMYRLSRVSREMKLRIAALENEKASLEKNLKGLESDAFVQESAVRESLGVVRPDEIVFEFR